MAALPSAGASPTRRAASAVDVAATSSAPRRRSCRKRRDWERATGIETTLEMDASTVPGGARRWRCTSSTYSSWMYRSTSNTR